MEISICINVLMLYIIIDAENHHVQVYEGM